MSLTPHAQQAIQWLEQQLTDLSGIRNATPRDPSFKNWRQATLTVMQRIWPSDQDRQERFRRIPFSPADPRADARTVREWYARGCQEAARVLTGFVNDVRAQDVPEPASDVAAKPSSAEFSVDFPTVDLPSGDLGVAPAWSAETDEILRDLGPSSGETPRVHISPAMQSPGARVPIAAPSVFASVTPPTPPPPAAAPAPPPPAPAPVGSSVVVEARQSKKGVGARLRDLLGFAQLSAKAFTGFPREQAPPPPTRPQAVPPPRKPAPAPSPLGFEIIPVGDEVTPTRPTSVPQRSVPASRTSPPASHAPASGPGPSAPPVFGAVPAPPSEEAREPGMSVVMSRPTTLRASIEKVSIESLISPEFRSPNDDPSGAATPEAPDPLSTPHLHRVTPTETPSQAPSHSTIVEPEPSPFLEPELPPPPATPSAVESMGPVIDLGPPAEFVIPPTPSQNMPMPTPSSANIPAPTPSQGMPAPTPSSANIPAPTPSQGMPTPTPSQSMPAPSRGDLPFVQPSAIIPMPPLPPAPAAKESTREASEEPVAEPASGREKPSKVVALPKRTKPVAKKPVLEEKLEEPESTEDHISAEMPVDPEEFAQATEDFMRSSPVLGATGRKVQRGYDDRGGEKPTFDDPDAIAVASLLDELDAIGVPSARHAEARARLLDLARRLEKGALEWAALRKAVWFAMEYPELARRVMPLLLPWIDRAA